MLFFSVGLQSCQLLVKMNDLPKSQQPRSDDPDFWDVWTGKDTEGKPGGAQCWIGNRWQTIGKKGVGESYLSQPEEGHDMTFTESNTVEQMILDAVTTLAAAQPSVVREDPPPGWGDSLGDELRPARWTYVPAAELPRQTGDVMVEPWVREALIRLNPEIAAQPDRADEVIYNLRACILSVQADGLVRANENFMAWLRGEKTMPFGPQRRACARAPGGRRPARRTTG